MRASIRLLLPEPYSTFLVQWASRTVPLAIEPAVLLTAFGISPQYSSRLRKSDPSVDLATSCSLTDGRQFLSELCRLAVSGKISRAIGKRRQSVEHPHFWTRHYFCRETTANRHGGVDSCIADS